MFLLQKLQNKLLIFISLIVLFLSVPSLSFAQEQASTETEEGIILEIKESGEKSFQDELVPFQKLSIQVTRGSQKGETVLVENSASSLGIVDVQYQQYKVNDKVKLIASEDINGTPDYSIDGQIRRTGLIKLAVLFVVIVLAVGKLWGGLSIVGLIISFLVIFKVTIPTITKGYDPVLSAVISSVFIIPVTFYISHGFNKKTHVGVIATIITLVITGLLATYFVNDTHLTGFASEEAGFLQVEKQGSINIKQLLLAGIIIGVLGILDDITISQAAVVRQIKKAQKNISFLELFKKGMEVGQDHISSMVNTLILVYAGSALPLFLLFFGSDKNFIDVLEFELIAEEIVKMLVGSIGLVLAAPLSTLLACYVYIKKQ